MKLSREVINQRLQESSRENCIDWRGSAIRSGDNIICFARHHQHPIPCQLIDIQDFRDIKKIERQDVISKPKNSRTRMILVRHRSLLDEKGVPRPKATDYCNIPDSLQEVVDTVHMEWVPATTVRGPCFIFHVDSIQRGSFMCKGMDRVFFIRYKRTINGKLLPLTEKDWVPFYRHPKHPDVQNFSESLWIFLISLKQEVQKALCRGGQWDGRTSLAKIVGVHSVFFGYIKEELQSILDAEISSKSVRITRSRKVIHDNLSCSRRKVRIHGQLIRILDEAQLDAVRKIFGVTFGVGVKHVVPSLKALKENPSLKDTTWLRNMDPVRVISCLPKVDDLDVGKAKPVFPENTLSFGQNTTWKQSKSLFCSFRGLDFRITSTKFGVPEMSVQCRFAKVRADSIAVRKILCGDDIPSSESVSGSASESSELFINTGDYITLEGRKVYVVESLLPDGTVRCVSPSYPVNEPLVLTMEEATEALRRSLE
jgi:hypothetical protein